MTGFALPSYLGTTQTVTSEMVRESAQLSGALDRLLIEYLHPESVPADERDRRKVEYERRLAAEEERIAAVTSEHQDRIAATPAGPLRDILELHAPSGSVTYFGCRECEDSEYGAAEFPCATYRLAAGLPPDDDDAGLP